MNLQQLRYVREAVRQGLNLTEAAKQLHTSQPGISRQVRELEEELGMEVFVRHGKRLVGLTPAGQAVVKVVDRILMEVENLRRVGREYQDPDSGRLVVATTHTQARYALPAVVSAFRQRFPKVHLSLQQGNPPQLAEMVIAGEADIAIATEAIENYPQLLTLPCYSWSHCVVMLAKHPLARAGRVTLEDLVKYPIVTYDTAFAGRTHIDAAFAAKGLQPDIVLSAIDADVIKTYVELGMGIGILASMAFDAKRDRGLRALDAAHLFQSNTTRVGLLRGRFLRGYAYAFIEQFAPRLSRQLIDMTLTGEGEMYEL